MIHLGPPNQDGVLLCGVSCSLIKRSSSIAVWEVDWAHIDSWAWVHGDRDWCRNCTDLGVLLQLDSTNLEDASDIGVTHIGHDEDWAHTYCGSVTTGILIKTLSEFRAGPPLGHWQSPIWCDKCLHHIPV